LFSAQTVDFVLDTLSGLGVTHVLCIGCPRYALLKVFNALHLVTTSNYTIMQYNLILKNSSIVKELVYSNSHSLELFRVLLKVKK